MNQKEKPVTIGLDLGERRHRYCVLDEAGEVVEKDSLGNERRFAGNSVRFGLKSLRYAVRNPPSERFHKVVMETLPEAVRQMIGPNVQALAELSARIKVFEREIELLALSKKSTRKMWPMAERASILLYR